METILNPFLDRGPVREPALFFGHRGEVQKLVQALGARVPQCCNLIGERRIGKTSILNYLAAPGGALQEFNRYLNRPAETYVFIRADLSTLKTHELNGALFFFRLIFRNLHKTVIAKAVEAELPTRELETTYKRYADEKNLAELTEFGLTVYLDEVQRIAPAWTLVFLLDEADTLIRQGVGAMLRSLIADRPLAYLLVTRLPLVEIDPEREVSPLFNLIAETLAPGLLSATETEQMLEQTTQAGFFSETEVGFIREMSGGHPDFVKVAARRVFDAKIEQQRFDRAALCAQVAEDLGSICQSMWDGLTLDEQTALLQAASGQGNTILRVLIRKAILTPAGKVFSPLFADFLAQKNTQNTPVFRFGEGYAAWGELVIKLSPIELKLLEYFYAHAGQVCSREELSSKIWGETFDEGNPAQINMAVMRLRQKLETATDEKITIQSARGAGYSLLIN